MIERRGFILLAYAHLAPAGWRSIVEIHHGYSAQRQVYEDGAVNPYLRLIGPEPGLHIADWCLLEFGLTRLLDWTDIGLVDGARMWRSEALGSERFETLLAEQALANEDWGTGEDCWIEYNATLYPNGPFSEAV